MPSRWTIQMEDALRRTTFSGQLDIFGQSAEETVVRAAAEQLVDAAVEDGERIRRHHEAQEQLELPGADT